LTLTNLAGQIWWLPPLDSVGGSGDLLDPGCYGHKRTTMLIKADWSSLDRSTNSKRRDRKKRTMAPKDNDVSALDGLTLYELVDQFYRNGRFKMPILTRIKTTPSAWTKLSSRQKSSNSVVR
jgi:hypothetical protein